MPRVSITVEGKTPQPYRFDLDQIVVQVGRAADNDIVIDCPSVSSYHCTMERVEGGYILRDNSSTNGIRRQDELMEIIDLDSGVDVFVGDVVFGYSLSDEEREILDGEELILQSRKKLPKRREAELPVAPAEPDGFPDTSSAPLPAPPRPVPPVTLSSAQQGPGFLLSLLGVILAVLAFAAGVNASYNSAEKKKGRENASFITDLREGREVLEKTSEQ